jgi:hypothetical protein
VFGKGSIIAPPEIVARYGAPPGGGKISARQGMPAQTPVATPAPAAAASAPAAKGAAPAAPAQAHSTNGKAPEGPKRGFVVYVDTTRIVIDLDLGRRNPAWDLGEPPAGRRDPAGAPGDG